MKQNFSKILMLILLFASLAIAQQSIYTPYENEVSGYDLKEFGKMWTFDDFPKQYIDEQYGLKVSDQWLEKAQLSALQFGWGCSGAFVSPEGLIMTNHHCGRDNMLSVQKEGEDLFKTGFYAKTAGEERQIPDLYVDQLLKISDVTDRIKTAMEKGTDPQEKVTYRDAEIASVVKENNEEGKFVRVVTLYNGEKYSLYIYKRYTDIRLVMAPEFQIASTGWDWDNFTYPRYEFDFMFFRAYENGEPVKTENYFKWSKNGAAEGEPIFVVGRPGNTKRLLTVDELTYRRDHDFKALLLMFNGIYDAYRTLYDKYPERESELLNRVMSTGNSRKVFAGRIEGLSDEYLLARKRAFEKDLKEKIEADPELKGKYGDLWQGFEYTMQEMKDEMQEYWLYLNPTYARPVYFELAASLLKLSEQKSLPTDDRAEGYSDSEIEEKIKELTATTWDDEKEKLILKGFANFMFHYVGKEHPLYKKMFGGLTGKDAVEYCLGHSYVGTPDLVQRAAKLIGDEIIEADGTCLEFMRKRKEVLYPLAGRMKEISSNLDMLNRRYAEAIFAVHGKNISPDATSTLRISDGVIKGYEYNGTIAPGKTTFFGLYDRYYSFNGKTYPWGLPEKWKTIPEGIDLTTPVNFASTNDIVGGNSGSSVINKNHEVVGLVFDGNMESLWGSYLFMEAKNRTVAVDSRGLKAALKYYYKTERLIKELFGE